MLKNKKTLLLILVALLLILIPNIVNAAVINATETTKTSTGSEVKWSYELEGDAIKNLKCTNITSVTGELTIPEKIDGYKITSLGRDAFEECYGLRKVTIPNGVISIGYGAFDSCKGLTNITIPNSVISIENYAFTGCSGLNSITLPTNLTILNEDVFRGCSGLTEVIIPSNVTTIDYYAFNYCSGLKFIKIPENVVSIHSNAMDFGLHDDLTIYGKEGSAAHNYAKEKNINFEEIENWDKRNEKFIAPKVKSITGKTKDFTSTSSGWEYHAKAGEEVSIIIEFDQAIVLNKSPKLTIKFGTGNNIELETGKVASNTLTYTYKVKAEDKGGLQILSLSGGDVTNNSGVKANFTNLPKFSGTPVVAIQQTTSKEENTTNNTENQDKNNNITDETNKQNTINNNTATETNKQNTTNNNTTNETKKENTTVKNENKKPTTTTTKKNNTDNTTAPGSIPYTGGTFAIIVTIFTIAGIGAYAYKRNKDLNGI